MSPPRMTPTAAILTYRDNGVTRAALFVDAKAAQTTAIAYAEVYGECDIHFVRHTDRVIHSKAVPHGAAQREPERIVS